MVLGYFKHGEKYYTLGVMVPNIKNVYEDRKPGGGNTAGPIFRDIVLELTKINRFSNILTINSYYSNKH